MGNNGYDLGHFYFTSQSALPKDKLPNIFRNGDMVLYYSPKGVPMLSQPDRICLGILSNPSVMFLTPTSSGLVYRNPVLSINKKISTESPIVPGQSIFSESTFFPRQIYKFYNLCGAHIWIGKNSICNDGLSRYLLAEKALTKRPGERIVSALRSIPQPSIEDLAELLK